MAEEELYMEPKGKGDKITIYVSAEDQGTVQKVRDIVSERQKKGMRTSLSFEMLRVLALGLRDPKAN